MSPQCFHPSRNARPRNFELVLDRHCLAHLLRQLWLGPHQNCSLCGKPDREICLAVAGVDEIMTDARPNLIELRASLEIELPITCVD